MRLKAGALTGRPAVAADGEVFVGDVVMTRRNDRTFTTTTGDAVRNRDRWTITATHHDGSITARAQANEATVTLPATYVSEFVQLAYATTEHGNQGITTDTSITLITGTTTGRGLYVGATRGRDDNQLLVVTDQHTERDAIDILRRVLATDRADTPAVTHRRQLAEHQPAEHQPAPPPGLRRRAIEPAWLNQWQHDVRERVPMIGRLLDAPPNRRAAQVPRRRHRPRPGNHHLAHLGRRPYHHRPRPRPRRRRTRPIRRHRPRSQSAPHRARPRTPGTEPARTTSRLRRHRPRRGTLSVASSMPAGPGRPASCRTALGDMPLTLSL